MPNHKLLKNEEFLYEVQAELARTSSSVTLISAFLKVEVLEHLEKFIQKHVNVTVVARWRLDDLISGVSDMSSYDFCKSRGWCFRVDNKLHAKALLCDDSSLLIGSANFTGNGTHLSGFGNNEISVVVVPTTSEIKKITSFVDDSIILEESIWSMMLDYIESITVGPDKTLTHLTWPEYITSKLTYSPKYLWVDECLILTPEEFFSSKLGGTSEYRHDFNLFASEKPSFIDFKELKIFKWLEAVLNEKQRSLSFGELTAIMHNSFLTDPKPYRSDVKTFLSVLFDWIVFFKIYEISRYRHRQVLMYP